MPKDTWIGMKLEGAERPSLRLLDEEWVQQFAQEDEENILFFVNVNEDL